MRRKRGEEPVTYMLPELEPILKETYGAILYQDQVMKIASAVAGFTLGEADILRAAMGKKDKVKMSKQREQFLSGATARGVAAETALELFELIALFAGYGFNGAHSISYGLIAYQTAYLKANYPREYMSALLNSRADNFDRLKQSILDAHARGLVVRPPDVNRSASAFNLGDEEQGEILYGLRHIKNVGERVAAEIVAEREAAGPFVSLFDLCLRVSSRDLNRRVVEALIRSGACDSLGERGAMLAVLDRAIDRANSIRRERESGQTSLFGDAVVLIEPVAPPVDDLDSRDANGPYAIAADERLSWEREFLGIYLSDHPLRRIAGELQERVDTTLNELGAHLDGLIVQVGGAIRDMRTFIPRRSTTGQRMASLTIEDLTGSVEVVVFARVFEECVTVLRPDAVIVVRGKVEAGRSANGSTPPIGEEDDRIDVEPPQILAEAVYAYDDPRLAAWRRDSTVHVSVSAAQIAVLGALRSALEEHHGDCPVMLHVDSGTSVDEISLAVDFSVDPGPALERAVELLVGDNSYRLEMHRVRAPERERASARR
jgi:DNA polymerase-3 subunit alpha